jgi:hypothetical protein
MIVVRLISVIFIALALMVLGSDLLFWLETQSFDPHTFIGLWRLINAPSAAAIQGAANRLPDFLSAVADAVLGAWGFVVLGLPGVVLAIIGTRR